MPRRKDPPPVTVLADDALEHILDSLEQTLFDGDADQNSALIQQLWEHRKQMPPVLAERLISGRARVPAFLLMLLSGVGGSRTATWCRKIAQSGQAPDHVRIEAQRYLGWPERGETKKRLAFLHTLRDPDSALVELTHAAATTWPQGCESLAEVVKYIEILPAKRRLGIATRAVDDIDTETLYLLRALVHVDDEPLQRFALSQLLRWRDRGSAGPLQRLARTARSQALRDEAAAAAQRLRFQVVRDGDEPRLFTFPPTTETMASVVDIAGGQMVIVMRGAGEGHGAFTSFFFDVASGIKEALGQTHLTRDRMEEILDGLDDQLVAMVDVDPATIPGLIAYAVQLTAAAGRTLPPTFEVWEPFLHDTYPPADDEPLIVPELDDRAHARRADLLKASGPLAEHDFFLTWGFDAQPTLDALNFAPPPSSGRWSERQYRPLVEHLITEEQRRLLRQALRRQAWLLEQEGETQERDIALALAAALPTMKTGELAKLPFLRKLLERSVYSAMVSSILPE